MSRQSLAARCRALFSIILSLALVWTLVPGIGWAMDVPEAPEGQVPISQVIEAASCTPAIVEQDASMGEQEAPVFDDVQPSSPIEEDAEDIDKIEALMGDNGAIGTAENLEESIVDAPLLGTVKDAADKPATLGLTSISSHFTSSNFCCVSTSAPSWRAPSAPSGSQYAPKTYYASAWKSTSSQIADDSSFEYQWFACKNATPSDLSESDAIEGQTSSTFVLTKELAEQLDGKHLFVQITSGDVTLSGPRLRNSSKGKLSNNSTIKKPVPVKTALDDKSYALIQDSGDTASTSSTVNGALEVGDVLWANVYDSEASPAARIATQDRWSFQWLYSFDKDASDAAYAPIEGQTSASFVLTEELAAKLSGAYVRVRITGDDRTLYGPSGSFDTPSSINYNTPGPITAPGQIKLDHILLSLNGGDYGYYEDTPDCNVGDTLEARTYDLDFPDSLYGPDEVDFSWQTAESEDGPFTEVATGAIFHADEPSGRFIKVVATAKNGIPCHDQCESPMGRILPRGVTTLSRIEILNASSAKFIGDKLVAQPYTNSSWGETPVSENVNYTWYWTDTRPGYGPVEPEWHKIEGAAGSELTVPENLEGCWVAVSANAGDNTVTTPDVYAAGPFRKAGTHELYYAALDQTPADENFTFWTGRTIGISARETSAAGTAGDYLSAGQLNYTWLISDSYDGDYVELDDENVHASSFVIPQSYAGKYLKCLVNAGFNVMEAGPTRKAIQLGETIEPIDPEPVVPEEPTTLDVTVRVTGVTPHAPGASFQQVAWIPTSVYTVTSTTSISAWDIFASMLDDAGYFYNLNGGCPYSITTPDRTQTLAMSSGAPWSYWSFFVNGTYGDSLPSGYHPKDGDVIELIYIDATGMMTKPDVSANPDAPVADWEASWNSYGSAGASPADVQTTVSSLASDWTLDYAQGAFASWSEPVIAGDYVFFTSGNQVLKIDAATGSVIASATLAESTAYGCRPIYANGMVVIPINNGRLQAVSALDLATVWLTDALPTRAISVAGAIAPSIYEQQSLSTLALGDDCVYAFTAEADWSRTYGGYSLCVDLKTGAIHWIQRNQDAGYYWAGAAHLNGFLLVAGDDGRLCAIAADSMTGTASGALDLGAPVRSTIVNSDDVAYVVTTDGVLHKVTVGSTGQPRELARVSFADYSTSSPAIADGVIYVGGSKNGQGVLAAIDAASMKVLGSVSSANDSPLPGEVKSMPTLVRDSDGIVALFTCNGAIGEYPDYTGGGGVYAYRLGNTQATLAFDPPMGMHNYSMGSIAYGLGRFYYVNDSGRLFALSLADNPRPDDPVPPQESGDKNPHPDIQAGPASAQDLPPAQTQDVIDDSETPLTQSAARSMGTIILTAPTATTTSLEPTTTHDYASAQDASPTDMEAAAGTSPLLWISIAGLIIAILLVISGLRKGRRRN